MKIKQLLNRKSKWCQGYEALTKGQRACKPNDPRADSYCLTGALKRCYPFNKDMQKYFAASRKLRSAIFELRPNSYSNSEVSIIDFNDSSSFDEVRQVLEKANV